MTAQLRHSEDDEARLLLITIMGQVMAVRVARAGVMRQMGWESLGAPERAAIQAQVRENLAALFKWRA